MAAIMNLVPYEITVNAIDGGSGKKLSNRWYYKNYIQTVAPPAYGAPIAGASDSAILLASFQTQFKLAAGLLKQLNHNYKVASYVSRAIIGKQFKTPFRSMLALIPGSPTLITSVGAHGLSTGDQISLGGVTFPFTANAIWTVTVLSTTQFTLNGSVMVGGWSGDGYFQQVKGIPEFSYLDQQQITPSADVGGVAGDAIPLFATMSVRRISTYVGRHFRSRVSLSPLSEADQIDGSMTVAKAALMVTALATQNTDLFNGGSDATSGQMYNAVVSRAVAFTQATPFISSTNFVSQVTSMLCQPNLGSLVRRKPRQSVVIT